VPALLALAVLAVVSLGSHGGAGQKSPAIAAGPSHGDFSGDGATASGTAAPSAKAGKTYAEASPGAGAGAVNAPEQNAVGAGAPGESATRLQQLGASISLAAGSEGVQAVADRVGALTVEAGGFVESSKVELQRGAAGEASLTLKLPSAKLAAVLARLQRLAPVRAETQSLQDLSGQYDAVGARLSAARAERDALLRALAKAETAPALESLHQRIAQADGTIAAAEREQARISHTASQAQVEVTVLSEAPHASTGLTLGNGLSDAGHVLATALAVALIALAVLIPLGLILAVLLAGARGLRRQRRERALDAR
jgi:hypothetical protein